MSDGAAPTAIPPTATPPTAVPHKDDLAHRLLGSLEILGVATLVSALAITVLGHDPFRTLAAIVVGAFGSGPALHATLSETVPLILAGLAVALPLRLSLFNVGAEGQLVLGGLAAGIVAVHAAPPVAIVAAIAVAALVGGAWGAIPGFLRARLGVHEVLSTILMNLIAIPLASFVVSLPGVKEPGQIDQTPPAVATLPSIAPMLGLGIVLALLFDWWLARTRSGLAARAIGSSPQAAENVGISSAGGIFAALTVGGALAGLVGAQQVLGPHGRYVDGFSPGFGFTAIAVALLGRGSGVGVVLAALALGALRSGAFAMDALGVAPREAASIVQGVVILTAAALTARKLGGGK